MPSNDSSNRPLHLVYVNPVGTVGGAERAILSAIQALQIVSAKSCRAVRFTLVAFADGPLRAEAADLGIGFVVVHIPAAMGEVGEQAGSFSRARLLRAARGVPAMLRFLRQLRRVLDSLAPTTIITNGVKANVFVGRVTPRCQSVVWYVQDYYGARRVTAKLLPWLGQNVAGAIVISRSIEADLKLLLPRLPVTVIRTGINLDTFSPHGAAYPFASAAGAGPRIGLVATYATWKGHRTFLDALSRLPADLNYSAFIVGGPIYQTAGGQFSRQELVDDAIARGLQNRVEFVPFQRDTAAVYRGLDVVVHASIKPEPLGLVIGEAMACGRAVVVAAAGGAAEWFTEGVDALGHAPGDALALSSVLERLIRDAALRTRLGTAARRTAEAHFGFAAFGEALAQFHFATN